VTPIALQPCVTPCGILSVQDITLSPIINVRDEFLGEFNIWDRRAPGPNSRGPYYTALAQVVHRWGCGSRFCVAGDSSHACRAFSRVSACADALPAQAGNQPEVHSVRFQPLAELC
jgi:hypothetical protein